MRRSTRSESTESRSSVQRSQTPSRSGSAGRGSCPPLPSCTLPRSSTRPVASSVTGGQLAGRLAGDGRERRFRLTDGDAPVHLYQSDVREFQLAKAAIRAGIEILLQHVNLSALKLDKILIGGAFATGMSGEHLIRTGFLPDVDLRKIELVGNVAGEGAKLALLNQDVMEEAERLAQRVEYLELSSNPRFSELYIDHIPLSTAPRS